MCFSATVSFGASAAIAGIGIVSLKKADTSALKLFAFTPLLFAMQQLVEGFMWLSLNNPAHPWSAYWLPILTTFYLIFAWLIWPFFIPLFMKNLERNQKIIKTLSYLTGIGLLVSLVLAVVLITSNIQPEIVGKHINFNRTNFIPGILLVGIVYVTCLLGPFLLTTTHKMKYLGAINLFSFLITRYTYEDHFISVWCFFAAISSVFVLAVIHEIQHEQPNKAFQFDRLHLDH